MLELRDYQEQALKNLFSYWEEGRGKHPVVVLPTGAGKSLLIAAFCERVCTEDSCVKILVVTHSIELIDQNHKELRSYYEGASTGVYSASLGHRNTMAQIIFVGIQSAYNHAFDFGRVDIVIVDEAQMISRKENTRYEKFFTDLKISNPDIVVIGMTATPFRLDSGLLTDGDGRLFDGIAHCTELKTLIKEGYLVPVISKGGVQSINLENVHVKAGDYLPGELAHAADDPILIKLAVEEIVKYGQERKSWLIYAAGVRHAEHVIAEIQKYGISCELLTGETKIEKRNEMIKRFREGKLRCLVNIGVLTTGFNAPGTDLIALLFSTLSTGKYIQVVGRGTRTSPGKENCLLLDYGGNVLKHGVLDEVDPVKRKNIFCVEKKAPPTKICPKCSVFMHARTKICPGCGFEFPVIASHGTVAYGGAVLSEQQRTFVVEVKGTWVSRHKKHGKPDSVKVAFYDAMEKEYPLWLALGSDSSYAVEKAKATIRQFGGKATTVDQALQESPYWKKVTHITVKPEGKFYRVQGFVFEKNQSTQSALTGVENG